MKGPLAVWLALLCLPAIGLVVRAGGGEPISAGFLAGMPILERGMTQIVLSSASGRVHFSVGRAMTPLILVCGEADTSGPFDIGVRLLAPLELDPAFLAVELHSTRVTGLMTLFFGPVAVDLGRTWFEPARWALVQVAVHPQLTMVAGGIQQSGSITPQVGWRLFPSGSARWEIGMMFGQEGIRFSFGGIL